MTARWLALGLLLLGDPAVAAGARVIAADTLALGGTRYVLADIMPPVGAAACGDLSCVAAAQAALADAVSSAPPACTRDRRGGHGIWVGRCTLPDGRDLGELLLRAGLATAGPEAPASYAAAEAEARGAGRGLWQAK